MKQNMGWENPDGEEGRGVRGPEYSIDVLMNIKNKVFNWTIFKSFSPLVSDHFKDAHPYVYITGLIS